jgi:hypothetical protein
MRRYVVLLACLALVLAAGSFAPSTAIGSTDGPILCRTKTVTFTYAWMNDGTYFEMHQRGCWDGMWAWSAWGPDLPPNGAFALAGKGVRYNANDSVTWWADVFTPHHEIWPTVSLTKNGAWSCSLGATVGLLPWASGCWIAAS